MTFDFFIRVELVSCQSDISETLPAIDQCTPHETQYAHMAKLSPDHSLWEVPNKPHKRVLERQIPAEPERSEDPLEQTNASQWKAEEGEKKMWVHRVREERRNLKKKVRDLKRGQNEEREEERVENEGEGVDRQRDERKEKWKEDENENHDHAFLPFLPFLFLFQPKKKKKTKMECVEEEEEKGKI